MFSFSFLIMFSYVCVSFLLKNGSRWEKREGRENETAFRFPLWRGATQGWCWVKQLFLFHAGDNDDKWWSRGGAVTTQDRDACSSEVPERGRGQPSWAQGQSRWGGCTGRGGRPPLAALFPSCVVRQLFEKMWEHTHTTEGSGQTVVF